MDVIINEECDAIPEGYHELTTQSDALLNLLYALDYDPLNPPAADLIRKIHHLEGRWVVLSPIHWNASHNDASIVAVGDELQLNQSEAEFWFKLYSEYLADEGLSLYYHNANYWLLALKNQPELQAKPPSLIINKSLMPQLEHLDKSMFWQKWFTESQMFFASLPNDTLINGVWPWGASKLGGKKTTTIYADSSFIAAAQLCSSNAIPYSPAVTLRSDQILIVDQFATLSETHQDQLKKMPVNWYWNNKAYTRNNNNWFIRIWRNLFHAH